MNNFVMAAELRVLELECVETMRALSDDFLHTHAVKHFDVLHCKHLEDIFIS